MISRMYGTTGKWTDFISSIIALNGTTFYVVPFLFWL